MRIFISVDIEGVTGVSRWEDTVKKGSTYPYFQQQMTKEVAAACKGAEEAGAEFILVKDAHEDGNNLIYSLLPQDVKIISGWSGHPYAMLEGLDDSFDAVMMIGYHSGAHSNGSPLSHTLSPKRIRSITINGDYVDEFLIHKYIADMLGVPVILVTGDGSLMRSVIKVDRGIHTVATCEGFGGAMISIHPDLAMQKIQDAARAAVLRLIENKEEIKEITTKLMLRKSFDLKIEFKNHRDAYKYSFYPGVTQMNETTISFHTDNYMNVVTLLGFII